MGGFPVDVRIVGPLLLPWVVGNSPMADLTERSRCAFSDSCSLDRAGLVPGAGEYSDSAGYRSALPETSSLNGYSCR